VPAELQAQPEVVLHGGVRHAATLLRCRPRVGGETP
jgi:hypothetical protein